MPVAVAGMHRSGTSMIAHALQLAGVNLGGEGDLYNERTTDNPDGYWEHVRFVALNEELLACLGGGWDRPPNVPGSWGDDPALRAVRRRARRLVDGFAGAGFWGWKDPRNSLTAPLWSALVPDLKFVVCIRHPLEVALSLHQRFHSYSAAFELWSVYNRRVVESTAEDRRIVTDYGQWLSDPKAEARRILGFLGLPTDRRALERASRAVTPDYRRQRATASDLIDLDISPEIVELYAWLRAEARRRPGGGRRSARPMPAEGPAAVPKANLARLDNEVLRRRAMRLELQLSERDEALRKSLAIEHEERLRRVELSERWAELLDRLARLEADRVPSADMTAPLSQVFDAVSALEERLTSRLGELASRVDGLQAAFSIDPVEERLTSRLGELASQVDDLQSAFSIDPVEERLTRRLDELSAGVDGVHGSVYDVAARLGGSAVSDYGKLVRRIKEVARAEVPLGATVLVVSKGDDDLLELYGRSAWHFPRAADGQWGGYHPKSALPAIAHLEALRAQGADHLLVPATSLWWLTEYPDLKAHLDERYRRAYDQEGVGVLYRLAEPAAPGESWRPALRRVLADFRRRADREPVVLDWNTGLELRRSFPDETVFSPPVNGTTLPHLDGTVDIVVLSGGGKAAESEAGRVASGAVVALRPGSTNGSAVDVRWKSSPGPALPSASIVIPCHDGLAHTSACVTSLGETVPLDLDVEFVVVDDGSTDGTAEWLAAADDSRLVTLRNRRNLGFLGSANSGARAARGEVLVFLNNDTVLLPGWLEPLLARLAASREIGAVGGRLLYPDGRLQEAGGLVFADGSAWKVGYGDPDPEAVLYSTARDVDYCSACLLATPRALFEELGGFDRRFSPGYYEDTDYCFRIRKRGLRVLYEPEATIVHVEGATAGIDLEAGPKRFQTVNHEKFLRKWRGVLSEQPARPESFEPSRLEALLWR